MWMLRFHLHIFYATPDFLLERCKALSVMAIVCATNKKADAQNIGFFN
jgi:hypothetical protein